MPQMSRRTALSRLATSAIAVGTAATLLMGCTKDKAPSEPLPDAAGLLKQSADTTKALTSTHLEIAVTGTITSLPVRTLTGDLTNVPANAFAGKAKVTLAGADIDVDQIVVIDGTLFGTLSPDNWTDFGPAADVYDPSVILNPDLGLANMLTSFTDPKSESTENVGGTDTVKVTGNVSADAVNKLIPPLKATAPIPGTAWIAKDGDHKLVQAKLDPTSDTSILITLSKWNEPVTVTKPQVQ